MTLRLVAFNFCERELKNINLHFLHVASGGLSSYKGLEKASWSAKGLVGTEALSYIQ